MQRLKMLSLAVSAALSLMAAAGVSTADATTLCTSAGCSGVSPYPAGTIVDLTLTSTFRVTAPAGTTVDTCTGSTIKGKTLAETGTSVAIGIDAWTWSGCTATTDTLTNGTLDITWISGTSNGTARGTDMEWTMTILGASCIYGTVTGLNLGTLTGGATPTLQLEATVPKTGGSFLCPNSVILDATYVVTQPHALFMVA